MWAWRSLAMVAPLTATLWGTSGDLDVRMAPSSPVVAPVFNGALNGAEFTFGDALDCVVCNPCPENSSLHVAVADTSGMLTADHPAQCMPVHYNACVNAEEHGNCKATGLAGVETLPPGELIRRVEALANGTDPNAIDQILQRPDVKLLAARSAIQVKGCDGELVAHIPLPKRLLPHALAD